MESRKKGLYTAKACRFCLSQDEPLSSLFEKKQAPKNSVPLSLKILSSISVEVFPSEKMPPYICRRCTYFMDVVYSFKNICREADRAILDFVQTGSALEPVVWPPTLIKLFRYGSKPANVNVVKVEGGATVEVSQSMSDDDEDENENVYNIKIGDGSEESTTACVKVVHSKDTDKAIKEKKRDSDDVETEVGRGTASGGGGARQDGCWACDECDCTYPLQQLLELHKMQKHRDRGIACDTCDAKFFSKNDLAIHMLRHTTEMPFACVACGKRFKRLILLKRHEKLMHSDLPQQKCPHCPASFLSPEECEAHQVRHRRVADRSHACTYCNKSFFERSSLMKHIESVHESKPAYACEYCPEQFTSISRLARHVRTHAGERPYPCKYCDKSFTKSHHYTRHLRGKHSDVSRGTRSSLDEYRCEQCTSAFQSQDELIYHSAIHATQNLTCPLCQEKFQDVDAVTAHIKSHVTGMEFMCDFCELVFTAKDKLDAHIDNMHEDELRNTEEMGPDDNSMDMDGEDEDDDDDDNPIKVKEEGDHMIVEIKKPNAFMLSTTDKDLEENMNNTYSEESEAESASLPEPAGSMPPAPAPAPAPARLPPLTPAPRALPPAPVPTSNTQLNTHNAGLSARILRKAEEVKRKVVPETPTPEKKEKPKTENANDKTLRLLEKELQELQRTNKREDVSKTPVKALETIRSRGRPPIHTSTPKLSRSEEKKSLNTKSTPAEKRVPERRAVKENKKPEDSKETKANNVSANESKEDKDARNKEETKTCISKEDSSKDKGVVRNGASGNSKGAGEEPVRRSSRPSKVKDYAKMVNQKTEETTPSDDDSDDDDEDFVEEDISEEKSPARVKARRDTPKASKPPAAKATPPVRKRGRPRKNAAATPEVPAKVKKTDTEESEESEVKMDTDDSTTKPDQERNNASQESKINSESQESKSNNVSQDSNKTSQESPKSTSPEKPSNLLPIGQTLKKVPIKALPPGVKPLPLPTTARPMGTTEQCEMQIGKKMVKVKKIVMTKAEVDAMTKQGLVEMKDGTMVLKPGVKIPSDPNALKSTLVGEGEKKALNETPNKSAPTRCDLDEA